MRERALRPRLCVAVLFLLLVRGLLVAVVPLLPWLRSVFSRTSPGQPARAVRESSKASSICSGRDTLGRDVLSRLALAGRISMVIAGFAVAISLVMGWPRSDRRLLSRLGSRDVIMGIADLQLSIPRVLLLIAVAAIVGTGVLKLAILLGSDELGGLRPGRSRHGAEPARARIRAVRDDARGHRGLEHPKASVAQRAAADADRRLV